MTNFLIDTNVILDIALKRPPFYDDAVKVFKTIDHVNYAGFISATTVTDIYYIFKKETGHKNAISFITDLIRIAGIVGVDSTTVLAALDSNLHDFEDAIQAAAAEANQLNIVVTRNTADFAQSKLLVFNPQTFITYLSGAG